MTPIAAAIDLLPTLADLAAVPVAAGKPLDGISVAPLLLGHDAHWPERLIFSHWNGQVSVRAQNERLDASGRLYDLTRDPGQARDIARDRPEVATRLSQAVDRWKRELLLLRKKTVGTRYSSGAVPRMIWARSAANGSSLVVPAATSGRGTLESKMDCGTDMHFSLSIVLVLRGVHAAAQLVAASPE